MTKTELIVAIAKEGAIEKKQAKAALAGLNVVVEKAVKKKDQVPLPGLGKFKVVQRKAREGRNPQTGEPIKIPAKTVVKFTVAKNLKDLVKKK